MFNAVDKKKQLLDSKRPMPVHTLKSLRESFILEWTYNSNAIEGNTLTLSETKVVLEGITIGGKTLREHLEVINHKEAILYVEDIVAKLEPLSEWQIKNIHQLVLKGINDENAGKYRTENVIISGATHIPPESMLVPQEMELLVEWYHHAAPKLHPIERAARLHVDFVKIHPFVDGNGRTARLLTNLELMKNEYPPIVIKKENRVQYYNALDKAHVQKEYGEFTGLVATALEETLDLYLKLLN